MTPLRVCCLLLVAAPVASAADLLTLDNKKATGEITGFTAEGLTFKAGASEETYEYTKLDAVTLNANPADPAPGGMSKGLIFGGIIAGVLLLMVVGSAGVVAISLLKHRAADKLAQAAATPAPRAGEEGGTKTPESIAPIKPHEDRPNAIVHEVEKPAEKPWLPAEEQAKVDKALARGLEYLRKQQQPNGTWGAGFNPHAMAALPGLTLLECGATADDPQVVKAAELVRQHVKIMNDTYGLALCILFLDRLGDPKDKPYIQTMALRLVAGQTSNGGWFYNCPILNEKDERELLEVLQDSRPARAPESNTGRPAGAGGNVGGPGESAGRPGEKGGNSGAPNRDPQDLDLPFKSGNPNPPGVNPVPGNLKGDKTKPSEPAAARATLEKLAPALKKVMALQPTEAPTRPLAATGASDNSNTQFAILAIWVSGRHDVPTEKVCALIDRRFRTSQGTGGNWGYNYSVNNANPIGSPAMTAAGLLGLAVGHGADAPAAGEKAPPKEGLDDEAIKKGFKFLSEHLGKSQAKAGTPRGRQPAGLGLYFLWSVERVGVMYNLRTIGDKDWYAWGSEVIRDHQNADGSWSMGNYHGSYPQVDTCFALLFLKRANLAKDLSTKVLRHLPVLVNLTERLRNRQ